MKDFSALPLGQPIPDSPHAVSVSMPKWAHVVKYEEGDPEIAAALTTAYPRFSYHPLYAQLCAKYPAARNEMVLALPSLKVAEKCVAYAGKGRTQETQDGVALAILPKSRAGEAKEFWCDTGLIVSSRQAEAILNGAGAGDTTVREELSKTVAALYGADKGDVYLHPTGMASIFSAFEAVTAERGDRAVQFGFPYVNTLKILERYGDGVYVPYNSAAELGALRDVLDKGNTAAVFCEIPGNPLLRTIDLRGLKSLLAPRGIPLVIDDTLGPPVNLDLMPYADAIVTSLTKFFSGKGDVTGGSLVLNAASPHYGAMKKHLAAAHEELLYPADAAVLLANAQGFAPRMEKINANAAQLADYLRRHDEIAATYYPSGDPAYDALKKPGGGYGGLLSFIMKDAARAPQVYDALEVAKGPSLGTEFTLACPYTLLAHFNERVEAAKQGVPEDLIRVSVGMEDAGRILKRFEKALKP
jgi:cystathionine gamma-synthase